MFRHTARRLYSLQNESAARRLTVKDLLKKYQAGSPLSMVTAYDFISARWAQQANADMILVGDSLAMCSQGYESTTQLSFEEFKYHVGAVCRAKGRAFVMADMPFGSFERSVQDGVGNALELMHLNPRLQAVKVECGLAQNDYSLEYVAELVRRGVSVMGHVGLTPQRVHSLGGYKVQGGGQCSDALALYHASLRLQEIGCFALLVECVPHRISSEITKRLKIPTIGIGAGPDTSGQVLVMSDLLGMMDSHVPKFVKTYANLQNSAVSAVSQYVDDVHEHKFPMVSEHTFKVRDEVFNEFLSKLEQEQ